MILPQIPTLERTLEYTQAFGGYNHNLRIAENELYDCCNLCADNYPVLSTRKARGFGIDIPEGYTLCGAVGRSDELYYILYDGSAAGLYKDGEKLNCIELTSDDTARRLLFFGAYLLIYPDCVYYNTTEGSEWEDKSGEIAVRLKSQDFDYSVTLQRKTGSYYTDYDIHAKYKLSELSAYEESEEFPSINKNIALCDENGVITAIVENADHPYYSSYEEEKITDLSDFRIRIAVKANYDNMKLDVNLTHSDTLSFSSDEYIAYSFSEAYEDKLDLKAPLIIDGEQWRAAYIDGAAVFPAKMSAEGGLVSKYIGGAEKTGLSVFPDASCFIPMNKSAYCFDYITECQNRLWACKYGVNALGEFVNEIYCSALGSFDEWIPGSSLSSGAYAASVGSPGAFTGAYVVGQYPVFFKEDCIHKVYISSAGAHQIATYELPGVEEGSSKSIVQINGALIYKARRGFVTYDGSGVYTLSEPLGSVSYSGAVAGADGNKYVTFCKSEDGQAYIFSYDTDKGIWHREGAPETAVTDMTTCDGRLYMIADRAYIHDAGGDAEGDIPFMLETGEIGLSSPDRKYISRLDLRLSLAFGSRMRFYIQYDSNGCYIEAGTLYGTNMAPTPMSLPILPRRCDHFRLKIVGSGSFNLYTVTKVIEEGR